MHAVGTKFTHHLTLILPHRPSQLPPPSVVAINNAWIVLLPAPAATMTKATKATVLPVAMVVTARPAAATMAVAAATMTMAPAMAARRLAPLPLTRLWAR